MDGKNIITVENLTHSYDNGFEALRRVNLTIAPGEMTAIIGQNGAGKTTLVKHFNGLLRPTAGSVSVAGLDAGNEKISVLARKVGFVFQNPDHQIFKETVWDEVAFGPVNLGLSPAEVAATVEEAMQAVGLEDCARVSPQSLSKGQRQRVALASVLAMKTDIIVLDEPTTGQDYREALQIMDLAAALNAQGHTILFITHDMSLVSRYARRAVVLCQGEIILDSPVREVFRQVETLNRTFLHPPQIVELAMALKDYGLPEDILTPEELYRALSRDVRRMAHASNS